MQVLRTDYRGNGKYAVFAAALNTIGRVINSLVGEGGLEVYASGEEIRIRGGAGGGIRSRGFDGRVWLSGKLFDLRVLDPENTGRYLRVIRSAGTVTRTNSPMPDPMPPNESWRDLSTQSGPVYIDC